MDTRSCPPRGPQNNTRLSHVQPPSLALSLSLTVSLSLSFSQRIILHCAPQSHAGIQGQITCVTKRPNGTQDAHKTK